MLKKLECCCSELEHAENLCVLTFCTTSKHTKALKKAFYLHCNHNNGVLHFKHPFSGEPKVCTTSKN